MDTRSLEGKIAIVTGGSRGIGKATALMMAQRGVKYVSPALYTPIPASRRGSPSQITITYASNADAANKTVSEIESHGAKAMAVKTPSAIDNAFTDHIVQETLKAFDTSGIDILVNNAGDMSLYNMGSITPENFNSTMHTNVLMPYLLTQSILPVIRPGGSIINISSRASRSYYGGPTTLYSASKAALEHLTRNIAAEVAAQKKITVNAVMPGGTETEAVIQAPSALIDRVREAATAEKRLGRPEEIADVVCFLAGGGGARWINGDTIAACGGATMI